MNALARKYTRDHEWISPDGLLGTIGITDYAQEQLGDVVSLELPTKGRAVRQFESVALIDSLKATSEIYSPVSGEIVGVNMRLLEKPELINQQPYDEGWIFRVRLSSSEELDRLLSQEQYDRYVEEEKKRSTTH